MNNKKGLSAVVATVLIILLVIAAITLVWGPIRNMINRQSEEVEADCLMVNPTITTACMRDGALEITVSNGAEVAIESFQVIYGNSDTALNNTKEIATSLGKNQVVVLTIASGDVEGIPGSAKIAPTVEGQACGAGEVKDVTTACA